MKQFDAILWDNDGILVDTEPLYFEANRRVLEELGICLEVEAFQEISLRIGTSVLELARDRGLDDAEIEALRLHRNAIYSELIHERSELYPGVTETLEKLSGTVRMAIVTSSNPEHFEQLHARFDILHFFEFVLTGLDFTRYKPHPEPYLLAAGRMGIEPGNCLVVEDSARGLASAVAAGMACAVIPHPLSANADFSAASYILEHISQVPSLLDGEAGQNNR